jgi:hypothetical protein
LEIISLSIISLYLLPTKNILSLSILTSSFQLILLPCQNALKEP